MKAFAASLLLTAVLVGPAFAQASGADHSGHHGSGSLAAGETATATDRAEGEVRRIDRDAGKLTLRHGEIRSLDMPPMTMVFQVKSTDLLDKVQVGDRIRFAAEKAGGAYVVTALEVVRQQR